ncbi:MULTISPECIES: hypothetical protein [unclassified Streptomyces]|uniref:hypothetical protein n=1 Tax=unclassified Streptomyces TaxID=2593676 RepID=UPI001BE58FA4|nr:MULTISPECIES: hypothetical protein [unclassified Streptomyces]MBT2407894.1 hypothetical protein [Streptomyces sp. ISL-21]MBT2457403.1 hypothetical protein [Streptomyces sp. ISL-86]MBT2608416.1 hypothetical protein [Streptomyces sp. ISL-87]
MFRIIKKANSDGIRVNTLPWYLFEHPAAVRHHAAMAVIPQMRGAVTTSAQESVLDVISELLVEQG